MLPHTGWWRIVQACLGVSAVRSQRSRWCGIYTPGHEGSSLSCLLLWAQSSSSSSSPMTPSKTWQNADRLLSITLCCREMSSVCSRRRVSTGRGGRRRPAHSKKKKKTMARNTLHFLVSFGIIRILYTSHRHPSRQALCIFSLNLSASQSEPVGNLQSKHWNLHFNDFWRVCLQEKKNKVSQNY